MWKVEIVSITVQIPVLGEDKANVILSTYTPGLGYLPQETLTNVVSESWADVVLPELDLLNPAGADPGP